MKKRRFLLKIIFSLFFATNLFGQTSDQIIEINYYGIEASNLESNMAKMISDLYYTQLCELQNYTILDKRTEPTFSTPPKKDDFSGNSFSFFVEINKNKKKTINQLSEESKTEAHKSNSEKKQIALADQAIEVTKDFVPEGSTIDRELNFLVKQWNMMISKEAYNNLTEDVNSLIRDYTRRVAKTLSSASFTKERILNLAEALCRTPNMQKIKDQKALQEYVALYILRLISNSKNNTIK